MKIIQNLIRRWQQRSLVKSVLQSFPQWKGGRPDAILDSYRDHWTMEIIAREAEEGAYLRTHIADGKPPRIFTPLVVPELYRRVLCFQYETVTKAEFIERTTVAEAKVYLYRQLVEELNRQLNEQSGISEKAAQKLVQKTLYETLVNVTPEKRMN